MFEDTRFLDECRDQLSREILETYKIGILGDSRVSAPSIDLQVNEARFSKARLGP